MLLILLSFLLFLCLIHLVLNYNKKAREIRKIPGLKDWFIFGNGLEIITTPLELFRMGRKYANKFNGIYRFWCFPLGAVNIYNPSDIEIILSNTRFNEKSIIYKFLKPWLREGLLLSKGLKWRQRRKVLTNAFHFNILSQFCTTLEENSQRLVEELEKKGGAKVDIVPILSEYTLNSICETSMGTRLDTKSAKGKSYKEAIHQLGKIVLKRFITIPFYSDFIFKLSSIGRAQENNLNILHSFTKHVIKERRSLFDQNVTECTKYFDVDNDIFMTNRKNKIALLDLLLLAEKEGKIDDVGIQEEVDTFMFEGHDTTASGLTFCLMSLANDKNIQEKILMELNDIFGDSNRPATMEDLSKMQYLECCIKEALRLYPPVHFISRQLNDPVELSNYMIPAGVICHIHIYDLHRNPKVFDKPLEFNPDRFLPENSVGRHPYAYIPFSAGPRNCIGQKFAMMELKSAVSTILRKYELIPVTLPSDLQFYPDLVLRNTTPVYVKFLKRN